MRRTQNLTAISIAVNASSDGDRPTLRPHVDVTRNGFALYRMCPTRQRSDAVAQLGLAPTVRRG